MGKERKRERRGREREGASGEGGGGDCGFGDGASWAGEDKNTTLLRVLTASPKIKETWLYSVVRKVIPIFLSTFRSYGLGREGEVAETNTASSTP